MPRKRKKLRPSTRLKLQQIIRLAALGRETDQIAVLLGMTDGNVTDLMNHPEYRKLERSYVEKMYGPIDGVIQKQSAQHIIEDAAPDAAEALAALLYDEDPSERRRAAIAVLDRSGHGPIQRKATLKRIELDPVSASLLRDAMQESVVEELEAEVVNE